MQVSHQPLFADHYLRAIYGQEFASFQGSAAEKIIIDHIDAWAARSKLKETSAEAAFMSVFFEKLWGYTQSGATGAQNGYSLHPKHPIPGAGSAGGTGEADAVLGWFGLSEVPPTPQVVCEFKDVRSNLDAPQNRKGNNRSPVKQCTDYLRELVKPLFGHEAIQPTWCIVTDMNEFRLYWRNTLPSQYQRFIISRKTDDDNTSLLDPSDAGSFQRFLFSRIFRPQSLLSKGGPCELLRHLNNQRYEDKEIENTFYKEYKGFREHLINVIISHNPDFPGTKGKLVRLTQKLIDRCIFVMFCEDMGEILSFPPNALRDYLADLSKLSTFQPDEMDAWNKLKELFHAMNVGKTFKARPINRFNGGLFAADSELDGLTIPNHVFCAKFQGENDETLVKTPNTLLYFAGSYNFGTKLGAGKAITLYTLGRIFEQSITELDVLEASVENKPSLTVVTKRKRDGVYYTPEWVVERIVSETLTPRLDELKAECGWRFEIEGDDAEVRRQIALPPSKRSKAFLSHVEGIQAFRKRLDTFTVLDPACGSGAFLIHTLEYLLRERRRVTVEFARVSDHKGEGLFEFAPADEIRTILAQNIYGVDVNPASVEIAQLALWLHTAKADQALSKLDTNIVTGNSLVGPDIYGFKQDLLTAGADSKERINAFDYAKAFPTVFDPCRLNGPGFDCVVGNPPYVKLQNFKKVYPETAEFLRLGVTKGGQPSFKSCSKGSFDLYIPFIEQALRLINEAGRVGFIAPSVWRYTDYGKKLREIIHDGGHLDRWVDFGSYQIFEEALIYCALQFYTRRPNENVRFALAPTGELALIPEWGDPNWTVSYTLLPKQDTWILVPKNERDLLCSLQEKHPRLDDPTVTKSIFVGVQTSADFVYQLKKVGPGRYEFVPPKQDGQKKKSPPHVVSIEDAIMRPLVSGTDAKRYAIPTTNTFILFPYELGESGARLISPADLEIKFPKAWAYLCTHEQHLRSRESGRFNDAEWYRFGRNQNLDKQEVKKLVVAQTVNRMTVSADVGGSLYLDNARAFGVTLAAPGKFWYLLGVLNSRVVDWIFKRIAKPKDGGYYEANRQFIAPLPIPRAAWRQMLDVSKCAKRLSNLYSSQTANLYALKHRLCSCEQIDRAEEWLWPNKVKSIAALSMSAGEGLNKVEALRWARNQKREQIAQAKTDLQDALPPFAQLQAELRQGELLLKANGITILDSIFIDDAEADQVLINWTLAAKMHSGQEIVDAEELADSLRETYVTGNPALARQIKDIAAEISRLESEIDREESRLNSICYSLYALSSEEIALIENAK